MSRLSVVAVVDVVIVIDLFSMMIVIAVEDAIPPTSPLTMFVLVFLVDATFCCSRTHARLRLGWGLTIAIC